MTVTTTPPREDATLREARGKQRELDRRRPSGPPDGPDGVYKARRAEGMTHDEAVGEAAHAFGTPFGLEEVLERARAEWETPSAPQTVEPVSETDQPAPDPLDPIEADARARVAELTEQRQRLSLDALRDEAAKQELANVESELAAAEGQLERIALARTEAARRDREAKRKAEREHLEALAAGIERLDRECAGLAAKADTKLKAAASALAEYQARRARRAQATDALALVQGHTEPTRGDAAASGVVQAGIAYHLQAAGCPQGTVRFAEEARGPWQPLAANESPVTGKAEK